MKAISLWQPWATMIREGEKTIETRMWATAYRGPLLICSTKSPREPGHLCGYGLCVAELVDCRPMTLADETAACCTRDPGRFSWVLADLRKIVPFEVKGKQGFFEVPDHLIVYEAEPSTGNIQPRLPSGGQASTPVQEKRVNVPKDAIVKDANTGEALDDAALAGRMRLLLAKEIEIGRAEAKVSEAADVVKDAKKKLTDARAGVQSLQGEAADILAGQELLF